VIIVASILFFRRGTFLTACGSLVALFALEWLVYSGKLPSSGIGLGSKGAIAVWFVSHSLGFLAVAYLGRPAFALAAEQGEGTGG